MKILLATTSQSKGREIRSILSSSGFEFLTLDQVEAVAAPPETGATLLENARLKAAGYRQATGYPSLADDSGLEVDALEGAPGVRSARYAPTGPGRIARVLESLASLENPQRSARFVCSICVDWGGERTEATGVVEGEIALRPSGAGGFGYDPIFYYPPLGKTFAEISRAEKNRVSHRARALAGLKMELAKSGKIRLPAGGPDPVRP